MNNQSLTPAELAAMKACEQAATNLVASKYLDQSSRTYQEDKFVANARQFVRRLIAEVEQLQAVDDPETDATDAAHPTWWRGNDAGVEAVVRIANAILDGKGTGGTFREPLESLRQRLELLKNPWLPISTAPKDGSKILAWNEACQITVIVR